MIAILDADGQDPPDLLPVMFMYLNEGYDVVNCIRKKRKENLVYRFLYFMFYRIYSYLVPFEIPLDSGDFSAMKRHIVDHIARVKQRSPFIRGIRSYCGGKKFLLEYERNSRISGKTKYSIYKLFLLAFNGITSFSKFPLRIIFITGFFISLMSLLYLFIIIILKILYNYPQSAGWSSLASLITFFGGLQFIFLGIIGEYLGHVFDFSQCLPSFIVSEKTDETQGVR